MSKKKKMRWVSNDNKGEFNEDALFSDSVLDAMIANAFKGVKKEIAKKSQPEPPRPTETLMERMMKENERNTPKVFDREPVPNQDQLNRNFRGRSENRTRVLNDSIVPVEKVQYVNRYQNLEKVMRELSMSEQDVIDTLTRDGKESSEGSDNEGNNPIENERSVSVIVKDDQKYLHLTDKIGNSLTIPFANESDPTFSIEFLKENLNETVADNAMNDYILSILEDLAATMAKVQIAWGKPDFVIESTDLDDIIFDNGIKSYDGIKLWLTTDSDDPDYTFGFLTTDMDKLVTEWQEIIDEVYETGNHEDFDELLITFAAAYRVMFNNMYICHGELRDSFVDFLCTNQNIKEVSDYICYLLTDVAKPSEEIPEFNITWNNTIQEVTSNNDIDETLLSGSTDVMSLFCEREDTCDSDEDEEVDEEESEAEAEVEEVPERIDAEEMARTFVEKYKQDHPDLSNNRGYVQPSESVGAPSGENPFRETSEGNTEPVNSEEAESSHSDVTGGNDSDESVGSGDSESNSNSTGSSSKETEASEDGTGNGYWNPYDKQNEEVKEETQKEERSVGYGATNVVKDVQEEDKKIVDDDDDLIINVTKG